MKKNDFKKISIIIPCHNEEAGLGHVLSEIPLHLLRKHGYDAEIIVIDNNSTDNTANVAANFGIQVIKENRRGKGKAMQAGFKAIHPDSMYVIMMDGDHTYKPAEILRLIEPLSSDFCDVVIGSRLGGKLMKDSLNAHKRLANWGFTFLVRHMYRANITDALSGYFAWKREVVDKLQKHLSADGFAIEMEMITKTVKLGYQMYSVPITYDARKGVSKVDSMTDGWKILRMFVQNLDWNPKTHRHHLAHKPPTIAHIERSYE